IHAKHMTEGSYWTVGWSFDDGSYVDFPRVTDDGYQTVRPLQENEAVPLDGISGRSLKPRIVQVALGTGADTSSPELTGTLEVEYDERPELIEEVACTVHLGGTGRTPDTDMELLAGFADNSTYGPLKVRLDGNKV